MGNEAYKKKEIIIALTGRIGVDFKDVAGNLKIEFDKIPDTECHDIRLSELIDQFPYDKKIPGEGDEPGRINFYMDKASELRKKTGIKSFLAILAMSKIQKNRNSKKKKGRERECKYTIYILNSLKRPEEAELLRNVYGRNFLLVAVQTPRTKIEKNIKDLTDLNEYKKKGLDINDIINDLIDKDYSETKKEHIKYGQNVVKTFPAAHFFVDTKNNLREKITRFVDILFGHPFHTPTIEERNMFSARGIALRSADPSRQVGAVIANENGNIIATGCNEASKSGGGFYEPGDDGDDREFKHDEDANKDTNVIEKIEILRDLIEKTLQLEKGCLKECGIEKLYNTLDEDKSKFTDLLEFGRAVHAELAAICDAAQRGVAVEGCTLYCTTYPCHLCIKHILAVGIKRVVYISPYPKSKTESHFGNSVTDDKSESEKYNKLMLAPFTGVSPRRFLHVFRHNGDRKEPDKIHIKPAKRTNESPFLKNRSLLDSHLREAAVLENAKKLINEKYKDDGKIKKFFKEEIGEIDEKLNDFEKLAKFYWEETVKKRGCKSQK